MMHICALMHICACAPHAFTHACIYVHYHLILLYMCPITSCMRHYCTCVLSPHACGTSLACTYMHAICVSRMHIYASRMHTSAYVSIRQHTSAYRMHIYASRMHTSAYVSIRQHTSAYVSIRQHLACIYVHAREVIMQIYACEMLTYADVC
jgi:hypothetical protein